MPEAAASPRKEATLAPWAYVAAAKASGTPQQWPIDGASGFVAIGEGASVLSLVLPEDSGAVALNPGLEAVSTDRVDIDGRRHVRISTRDPSLFEEFYGFIGTVLRSWIREGAPFDVSFAEGLAQWRRLLAATSRLTPEQQVGLYGELLIARLLIDRVGPGSIGEWTGPAGDDHDFRRPSCDLEVKTTTSNVRSHWVHGARQLIPAPDRPLVLISVHLKAAAATAGSTLPQLIEELRLVLAGSVHLTTLESALAAAGYHEEDRALYPTAYVSRSPMIAIRVDVGSGLPVLSPDALGRAVGSALDRLGEVRYQVNVEGLGNPSADDAFWVSLGLEVPHG